MQSNPVVVDGVLYVTTPTLKVVAVNAATGAEIWKFDPSGGAAPGARFRHRGVTVHKDRVFVSYRSFLYALDRKTGKPIASFGTDGRIDLREGLGMPAEKLSVSASTPGVVFEDLLIMGSSVPETIPGSPGHIRAFDVNTRRAALDLPHHSAARRVRLRHLVEGRLQAVRRRERVGRRHRRREERDGVRRHRLGVVRFLRRRRATATTCSPTACSRSTRAPASASGTSRASSTTSGTTTSPPRRTWSRSRATAARSTPSRRSRSTATSTCSNRQDRRAAVPDRIAQGAAVGDRWRASVRAAAVSGEAAAVHAPGPHRGHADDADAGGARRRAGAVQEVLEPASSRRRRSKARSSSPASTAAPNGAARRSIPTRRCSTSTRTRCRGSSS